MSVLGKSCINDLLSFNLLAYLRNDALIGVNVTVMKTKDAFT